MFPHGVRSIAVVFVLSINIIIINNILIFRLVLWALFSAVSLLPLETALC